MEEITVVNDGTMYQIIQDESVRVDVATLHIHHHEIHGQKEMTLEADPEIIENIIDSSIQQRSEAKAYNEADSKNITQIQAVVDLEELGEIIGATEDQILEGLQKDSHESKVAQNESLGKYHDIEQQQILTSETPAKIELDAEPFIETLTNVLQDERGGNFEDGGYDAGTAETEVLSSTYQDNFAHEAFLLEIPCMLPSTKDDDEEPKSHFVLALPEIDNEEDDEAEEHTFTLLERAFSTLPTDVQNVTLEAKTITVTNTMEDAEHKKVQHPTTEQIHLDVIVKRSVPTIGYVILIVALFSLASSGTALEMQKDTSPLMKSYWRLLATSLLLIPFVLKASYEKGKEAFLPKIYRNEVVTFCMKILLASIAYSMMLVTFVVSLSMTSLANAFVFSNMTSLVIIAGKAVMGIPILLTEGIGAIIGFVGGVICAKAEVGSHETESIESEHKNMSALGDLVAFASCLAMATYLVTAKSLRASLDFHVFAFYVTFFGSFVLLALMISIGESVSFGNDPTYGVWGWTKRSSDRLPLELYIAIVCNLFGSMGYVAVMKYFDPVVVSTVMLMEPVVAVFIGFFSGVDPLPGMQTWIGDLVVAFGTFLVIYSGSKKTESIDVTKALHSTKREIDAEENFMSPKFMKSPIMIKSPVAMKSPVKKFGSSSKKNQYGSTKHHKAISFS